MFRDRYSAVHELGRILMIIGLVIIVAGALLWSGYGSWMGKLPGDIRIERGNSGFYFPVVTCIVISAVLSLLMWIFRR
jgi:drug/metabolite transporter (DMT)-like permease